MLTMTRGLILEKTGYRVHTAMDFSDALLLLADEEIDILLLCQTLSDEERRGILETAHVIRPDIKCAIFGYCGREVSLDDEKRVEKLDGPNTLIAALDRILNNEIP